MSGASSSFWSITGLTVLGGAVAYAVYFDQKRRSDPTFRRKIRQQRKKVAQWENESRKHSTGLSGVPREVIQALYKKATQEPLPASIDERHLFFSQAVGIAEQLSALGPDHALDAGMYFFQGLRAYPDQSELAAIYQKTLPEKTLAVVMELYALDQSQGAGNSTGPSPLDLDAVEPSPISKGPPSEAGSQEWDKLTDPGTSGIAP